MADASQETRTSVFKFHDPSLRLDLAEHDLDAVAFPKLSETQLAVLEYCPKTTRKRYRRGEKLFEVGDRDFRFFVIAPVGLKSSTRVHPFSGKDDCLRSFVLAQARTNLSSL